MGHRKKILMQNNFANFPFVVFILLGCCVCSQSQAAIKVDGYGVRPVKFGDTAMVFYATVTHTGATGAAPLAASLRMESCCLVDSNGTNVCDAMKLISGLGSILHPKGSYTLQMYFVNYDLSDRDGNCTISLLTMPSPQTQNSAADQGQHWEKAQDLIIPFQSGIGKPNIFRRFLIWIGWAASGYRVCNSGGPNEMQECSNQNCQLRFIGTRNFHSKERDQCEPTPECDENGQTMLSPITGKCETVHDVKHIRSSFTREMIIVENNPKELHGSGDAAVQNFSGTLPSLSMARKGAPKPSIVCKHGDPIHSADGRSNCSCHKGWRSLTSKEWEQQGGLVDAEGGGTIYIMCDTAVLDEKQRGLLLIAFVVVAILTPVAALIIFICRQRREDKKKQTVSKSMLPESGSASTSGMDKPGEDDADRVISEISQRREPRPMKSKSRSRPVSASPSANNTDSNLAPAQSKSSTKSVKNKSQVPSKTFTAAPSTDELLTLKEVEKSGAHIPIAPVPSNTSIPSVKSVVVQPSLSKNMNHERGMNAITTISTEEITERKKKEWDQFMKSVSAEQTTPSKPAHCSISVDSDIEEGNLSVKGTRSNINFNYLHEDKNSGIVGAIKVHSSPAINYALAGSDPRESLVQQLVERMPSDELVTRQEAYNLLSSLSNPKLPTVGTVSGSSSTTNNNNNVKPSHVLSSHSIWSNVASENATEPEPEVASSASSYSDVRTRSLYASMETDEDSDGALDKIALSTKTAVHDPRLTVAEVFEHNQKLYRFPQTGSKTKLVKEPSLNWIPLPLPQQEPYISSMQMESDSVPSDAYLTTDSTTLTSPSQSVLGFWNQKLPDRNMNRIEKPCIVLPQPDCDANNTGMWLNRFLNDAQEEDVIGLGGRNARAREELSSTNLLSPNARSAYRIKSSLENSLKASRSKSDTSVFHF